VQETCRNAQVVFDKFHVILNANKAVDQVRRAEVRLGGAGVWEALHQSQWLWRKNPENLTPAEAARLGKIDQKSLRTAKAYQMRLVLQDIYRSPTASVARQRFRAWCRWVRWVAGKQPKNLLRAMVKVADLVENLVEKHLAGILAHWKWGVTNAFMEGLNSVFSATKRKARGYRSTTHMITMLYFVAGKLRFPQF
jgi:transposase